MIASDITHVLSLVPPSAKVFVEADHGQQILRADGICVCTDKDIDEYDGDDYNWNPIEDISPEDYSKITAVVIIN